jgi:hypothetical protein
MTIDAEVHGLVDSQLMDQGSFSVLDFLMDSGRLLPEDYERWRRCEIDALDAVLMGSTEKIRLQVEAVAHYARRIGLVQQSQTFHAWRPGGGTISEPLRISADAALDALIAARFVPAQNVPQLDLFFDNPVVTLTNGIVSALSAGNRGESRRLLDRLYREAPNHADLPAFDRLLEALGHGAGRIEDPRRELAFLRQITPDARRLMGSQVRDLLGPSWRHLAEALRGRSFESAEPDLHRSFSLCQAQDWEAAARAIVEEPQWPLHAPLCLRLAQCRFHLRDRSGALAAWFQVCWHSPREAAAVLDAKRQPDTGLGALWQRFIEAADESTVDAAGSNEALGTADFPAWLLLHEPGLSQQLAGDLATGTSRGEQSYRCVHRWIDARRAGRNGDDMALRKTLQALSPRLLYFLKRTIRPEPG